MIDLAALAERVGAAADKRERVWDALFAGESVGRIAVGVGPGAERIERLTRKVSLDLPQPENMPLGWTEEWESALRGQLISALACAELPGYYLMALYVPRFVHKQSQGLCEAFGMRVELQDGGIEYAHPLPPDPALIDDIQPKPLRETVYWGAIEWLGYARKATGGAFEFRCPVMTGPIDTANYILGTTTLMDWIYSQPDTLHRLLDKVTDVLISTTLAVREAAGGTIQSHHLSCMRGGPDFCSEVRALLSSSVYQEFEAPYLRRIGEAVGPYSIHSCGSWERTIPSAIADANLRAMHGQIRENDLATLCEMANGRITLSINRSVNVHERHMWPDGQSYFRHILETVPPSQPLEVLIYEDALPEWNRLCSETGAERNALSAP